MSNRSLSCAEPASPPLVSFVVPCYNHEPFIAECLQSILAQQGGCDYEVIVVDDASTDRSQHVLQHFNDHPRVRIILHQHNQGHVATLTEALNLAKGAFIARIDGDDRYRPDFLATTLDKFDRYPEVGMVYGDAALIDQHGEITEQRSDKIHGGVDAKRNELVQLLQTNFICAPTVIARREAWLMALPIPPGLAFSDWYFTLMMARRWEFYYVADVIAEYRVHPGNLHTAITRNKTEEPSTFWLLDTIFSQREEDVALEMAKQRSRRSIYASHWLTAADKYFGSHMDDDARRCYFRAFVYRPQLVLKAGPSRRLLGTAIGRRRYESGKLIARRLSARVRPRGEVL